MALASASGRTLRTLGLVASLLLGAAGCAQGDLPGRDTHQAAPVDSASIEPVRGTGGASGPDDSPSGEGGPGDATARAPTRPAAQSPELADTPLGRLAADLAPGQFGVLATRPPAGVSQLTELFHVDTPDGRRVPIDAWTDSAHWDADRKQTLFQGLHETNKFIAYDAGRNTWRELGWQGTAPPRHEPQGYTYGRTALDARRGHFYRLAGDTLYRYDIEQAHWRKIEPTPIGGYTPLAWHRELDMLVNLRGHVFRGFDGERWHELGESSVSGEYSAARYNPARREVLAIGGDSSESAVSILDAQGDVRQGAEAPFAFQLSLDNLTYDPQSGRYLVLRWAEKELWEYDGEAHSWRLARSWSSGGWPFKEYGTVVPIPIDELGVIFWQYEHGPRIYRHDPAEPRRLAGGARSAGATAHSRQAPPRSTAARAQDPGPGIPPPTPRTEPVEAHERLAAIGQTMKPGEWRYIGERAGRDLATYPDGASELEDLLFIRFCDDGELVARGTQGNGWTNSWQYDPQTGSFWFLAMRDGSEKKLVWLDRNLRFGVVSMPWGHDCSNNRRPFNRLTVVDGKLYWPPAWWGDARVNNGRMHIAPVQPYLDGETDVSWALAQGPGWGETHSGQIGDFAVTWVPEIGGWIMQQPGSTRPWNAASRLALSQEGHTEEGRRQQKPWGGANLWHYRPGVDDGWVKFDFTYGQGYQGLLLYNPIKHQVLALPGPYGPDGSIREFTLIHPSGGVNGGPWAEKLDQIVGGRQRGYSAARTYMTYHPVTGQWLWLGYDEETMWISDDGKHWSVYEDFSAMGASDLFSGQTKFSGGGGLFGASESIQVTAVPGTDLLLWFDYYAGLILHRLKEPAEPPSRPPRGARNSGRPSPGAAPTGQPNPPPASSAATPTDFSDSWLARQAAAMAPGDWHFPVDGSLPDYVSGIGEFWTYQTVNSNSNDFWAPVSVWNPEDARTYSILDRTSGNNRQHSVVFFSYDALTHSFRHNPLPGRSAGPDFGNAHVYGRWALDVGRQKLYRPVVDQGSPWWVFDIESRSWTRAGTVPFSGLGGGTSPIAMHEALGELLGMDDAGVITAWNPDTGKTRRIGRNPAQKGSHAQALYNPVRREWAIAYGNGGSVATLVTADEQVIPVKIPDAVREGGSATSFFFYDPITGNYLTIEHNRRQIWEYDPDRNEWAMALDLRNAGPNFPPYHGYVITPIPEAGVILWLHRSSSSGNRHQRLYKHESVFR